MSVESKTIILYVNINFTGNLFFGFGRYYGKVFPESAVFHLFRAPVYARNDFSIFFFTFLANSSRNKRESAFFSFFIGFEIINFIYFL